MFDSVVQLVHTRPTGATKVVVFEGTYTGEQGDIVKAASTSTDGLADTEGFLFKESKNTWSIVSDCRLHPSQKFGTNVYYAEKTAKLRFCVRRGTRVRFVVIAEYTGNFGPNTVIPWTLMAHRFLKRESGTATYCLMGSSVRYPEQLYLKPEEQTYSILHAPKSCRQSESGWQRTAEAVAFLREQDLRDQLSLEQRKGLNMTLNAADASTSDFIGKGVEKNLLFTFDRESCTNLLEDENVTPRNLNIVVFGEGTAPH